MVLEYLAPGMDQVLASEHFQLARPTESLTKYELKLRLKERKLRNVGEKRINFTSNANSKLSVNSVRIRQDFVQPETYFSCNFVCLRSLVIILVVWKDVACMTNFKYTAS